MGPTGRLHVRFVEGTRAENATAALRALGFVIERLPAHAPHTVWVRPRGGTEAADVGAIRSLRGVVKVEPETLGVRAARTPKEGPKGKSNEKTGNKRPRR